MRALAGRKWGGALLFPVLHCAAIALLPIQASAAAKPRFVPPGDLAGSKVTIELQSGATLTDVEVVSVVEGTPKGTIALVALLDAATGQPRSLMAMDIASLSPGEGTVRYVFVKERGRLWPDDKALADKMRLAAPPAAAPLEKKPADKKLVDKKLGKKGTKAITDPGKLTANKQELPLKNRVSYWPVLDKEGQVKAIEENKAHLKKIGELLPGRQFTFVETDFFLFYSDLAPSDLRAYVPYLDAMYRQLLKFFEIKPGTNIWRGKASVVIFAQRESYMLYARKMRDLDVTGVEQGRCFHDRRGDVVTAIHTTGSDRKGLAATIVHETTHGFVVRYKTNGYLPSWLNEGLAEHIAALIVPGCNTIQEQRALRNMRTHGTLGTGFYGDQINPDQYGVAYCLVRYMVIADAKRFKDFFETLKSGATEEDAMKDVYGIRREALVAQFGRSLRIPNLQPDLRATQGINPLDVPRTK